MRRQVAEHGVQKSSGVCKKTAEQCAESVYAFDNIYKIAVQPLEAELQADINAALASSHPSDHWSDIDSEAAIIAQLAESRSQWWGGNYKFDFREWWGSNYGTRSNYCDAKSDGEDECDKEESIKNAIKGNTENLRWIHAGYLKSGLDQIEGNEADPTTNTRMNHSMRLILADSQKADWYKLVAQSLGGQDQNPEMLTPEKWISLGKVLSPILTEYADKVAMTADAWAESGCLQYYFQEHLRVTCK